MLSLIILIPLVAALLLIFVSRDNTSLVKTISIGSVSATLAVSLLVLASLDMGNPVLQFVQSLHWVPALNFNYLVGADGISLWMGVLTAFLGV